MSQDNQPCSVAIKKNVIICFFILLTVQILGFSLFYHNIKKKINHRYFCIKEALEQIHNVEIRQINGDIVVSKNK